MFRENETGSVSIGPLIFKPSFSAKKKLRVFPAFFCKLCRHQHLVRRLIGGTHALANLFMISFQDLKVSFSPSPLKVFAKLKKCIHFKGKWSGSCLEQKTFLLTLKCHPFLFRRKHTFRLWNGSCQNLIARLIKTKHQRKGALGIY